jgi:prepilin-type N-terminal cleavage/methylation domain-containing protein
MDGQDVNKAVSRFVLVAMGLFFLVAASLKAIAPTEARTAIGLAAIEFAGPGIFTRVHFNLLISGVVAIEAALGAMLLLNVKRMIAALSSVLMLLLFTVFLWGLLRLPEVPSCGCGGAWSSGVEDGRSQALFGIFRNIGLAVLTGWAACHSRNHSQQDAAVVEDQRTSSRGPAGFTLIELMVTIAVIAVLIAITIPSLASARKSAKQSRHLSNTRQLLVAIAVYASESNERFPALLSSSGENTDALGRPLPLTAIHPHSYLVRNTLKWTNVMYDLGYELPEEGFFGPPDELNPVRRTHYLLTGAAFAEPEIFVDDPVLTPSLFRVQTVTRVRYPSAKGYLLATHSDVWPEDREDLDPVFVGLGDGSASKKTPLAEALSDPNGDAIGITFPVLWTRHGLDGRDFD